MKSHLYLLEKNPKYYAEYNRSEVDIDRYIMRNKFRLLEKRKYVVLLLTLIGLLFSILPVKFNTPFNIFIPGIVLLIIPVIYLLVWENETITKSDEIFIFSLIMITIFFNLYICALRFGHPLGLDAQYTLWITRHFLSETGEIITGIATGVTFGYPGLYILYTYLSDLTGADLNIIATYIPPAISMFALVFFYFFIRRFFEPRLSLLAVFLCGWEHTVYKFGFEYRTQSLAIVIFMMIMTLIAFDKRLINNTDATYLNKKEHESIKDLNNSIKISLLILISVVAILITHFVTAIIFICTELCLYCAYLITRGMNWKIDLKISQTVISLTLIIFIAYMMYVGHFFGGVVEALMRSTEESLAGNPFGATSKEQGLIAGLYGPFIFCVTWLTRFVFIGSCIVFFQKKVLRGKKTSALFILGWAGVLLLIIVLIAVKGHMLNPGRVYNFFAFPFSIILSFGLIYILRKGMRLPKSSIKILITIFLILFVISSLLKLPNSIIGDTQPFRGYHAVDDIHWEQWEGNYTRTYTDIMSNENELIGGG